MKEYTEADVRNALREVYHQLAIIREHNRYMLEKIQEIHGSVRYEVREVENNGMPCYAIFDHMSLDHVQKDGERLTFLSPREALERAKQYDEAYQAEVVQTAYGEMLTQEAEEKSDVGIHK